MPELGSPEFMGTLPQWGTFIGLLTILAGLLTVWIKGIPERLRSRSEVDRADIAEWRAIEKRVTQELEDCKRDREADAAARDRATERYAAVENRNFRLEIVTALVLQELERLDPHSDIIKRAQAIMVTVTQTQQAVERKS